MTDTPLTEGSEALKGEAPRLSATLKPRHVAMISIGGIIGAGLFVNSSAAIASIGPAMIVCYILAGILILLSMRMLGELAVANPHTGFFTDYARKVLGHPFGFVGGWLYWYFWMVVVAVETLAGVLHHRPMDRRARSWLIGLVLLVSLTAVNLMSARSYGEFEFWFSSIKVAAIIAFILVTGSYVLGLMPGHAMDFSGLTAYRGFAPYGALSVLAGVATVIFSLTGAEITTVAAAESKEPARAIASMTTTLDAAGGAVLCAVDLPDHRRGELDHHQARSFALCRGADPDRHSRRRRWRMNIIVLTAVLSCLNSGLYVTSRALFALAAHGDAPQALVVLNKRKVPARAILAGTVFAYGAIFASIHIAHRRVHLSDQFVRHGDAVSLSDDRRRPDPPPQPDVTPEARRNLPLKMWLFPGTELPYRDRHRRRAGRDGLHPGPARASCTPPWR